MTRVRWQTNEDALLRNAVSEVGDVNKKWKVVEWEMMKNGVQKTHKQCKERFMNHLTRDINKGKWSAEEERDLVSFLFTHGPKWSRIRDAAKKENKLAGRTSDSIKQKAIYLKLAEDKTTQRPISLDLSDLGTDLFFTQDWLDDTTEELPVPIRPSITFRRSDSIRRDGRWKKIAEFGSTKVIFR
jgi:hypothetical protein